MNCDKVELEIFDAYQREKIAKRLIALRGKRTQQEVADKIGVSRSSIGMYESGERIPRDQVKVKLANYYGTTVMDIFFK